MKIFAFAVSLIYCFFFSSSACLANTWKDTNDNELTIVHGKKVQDNRFTEEVVDINYDFSKIKNIYIPDVEVALSQNLNFSQNTLNALKEVNEKGVKKYMKRKIVDKEQADVILETIITEWKSGFSHRVPERTVYEAYESYEGYKEVKPSFAEQSNWERRKREAEKEGRRPPPRPRPRREWTVSDSWFFGSHRVVTPYSRFRSRRISSDTPFSGSKKVTYPAYDLFSVTVIARFNLRDAKTNSLIMSRKGTITDDSRSKEGQLFVYKTICDSFCEDYKLILKQVKKEAKKSKKDKQNLST